MYPHSPQFAKAIRSSGVDAFKVEVVGKDIDPTPIPIFTGSQVVEDATTPGVRRTLTLTTDREHKDLLTNPWALIRPYRGVRFTDRTKELLPLGVFVPDTARMRESPEGNLTLTCPDLWVKVKRAKFVRPFARWTETATVEEITALVRDAIPTDYWDVMPPDWDPIMYPMVEVGVWEEDRETAINDLSKALGMEVFFDENGLLTIRPIPTIDQPAVWDVGAGNTSVLIDADHEFTKQFAKNVIVVTSTATDGSAPFDPVIVQDDTSATGTQTGLSVMRYTSGVIESEKQAYQVGLAELKKRSGVAHQITIENVCNPALRAGDVAFAGEPWLLDQVTIPLVVDQPQQLSARKGSFDDGDVTESET